MLAVICTEYLAPGMTVEVPEDKHPSGMGIVESVVITDQWDNVSVTYTDGFKTYHAPGDAVEVYNVPVGYVL